MTETHGVEPTKGTSARGRGVREAAYLRRVTALEQAGLYDEAIRTLEKAIALSPGKASYCVRLAELYRSQRKIELAVEAMKRAIELDPRNPSPQEALLQMYVEAGWFDEAIRESKGVLKQHPRNLFARNVLGVAYLQKGLIDKALEVTTELVHLDPTDAVNHFKKGVLFQQKGDCARAIEEFGRVIDLEPEGEISEEAREAVAALDSYQLRQIATLAVEDRLFLAKLLRDPELAVTERGFVLSFSGILALRQIDFDSLSNLGQDPQRYYH